MKIYVGQTRSRALIERLQDLGYGEMVCPNEVPARRRPWAYDNGAFKAWKAGAAFDADSFIAGFEAMRWDDPDFIVAPDIVAGGAKSLAFSQEWRHRLRGVGPLYLAVQDGMIPEDVLDALREFDGLFVGGTLPWKLRTGADWVALAHKNHKPCHIGRVGTFSRVRWARRIGADSIDSSLPLWSEENLGHFIEAVHAEPNMELFA